MEYKESKLQIVFTWVYTIFVSNIFWYIGVILGLGVFGIIPATICTYRIFKQTSSDFQRPRLRIFHEWGTAYKEEMKKHALVSFAFSMVAMILILNYSYLRSMVGLATLVIFYLTLILGLFLIIVALWYAFVAAYYPKLPKREIFQNAISFPLLRVLEMTVLIVLIITLLVIISELQFLYGLMVLTGSSLILGLTHYVFKALHDGRSIKNMFIK